MCYTEWFWMINIIDETYNKLPQLITDWLTFLPSEFSGITAIYQRPSGEVVIFVDNLFYMMEFPSLSLVSGYPKYLSELGMSRGNRINAVVNTHTGRTFIFYNNDYYLELDECSMRAKKYGIASKTFPWLPTGINSAFRFTNGNLYFLKNMLFYEYSEFSDNIVRAGKTTLSLFGIRCISSYIEVIQQIKKLVSNLGEFLNY